MTEQNAMLAVEETANEAMSWLASNHELMIQYGVNIITAIMIMLVGNWVVKKVAGSVAVVLKKRELDQTVVDFICLSF